jgi:signal transduction histidine kinase
MATGEPWLSESWPFEQRPSLRARVRNSITLWKSHRFWLMTMHLLVDLLVGTVTFSLIVSLLATSIGLTVTFLLAIPAAWLTIAVSMWLADLERARAHATLDMAPIPSPHRAPPEGATFFARLRHRVSEGATWLEFGYHVLLLPVGVLTFVMTIAAFTLPIALVLAPLGVAIAPGRFADLGSFELRMGPGVFVLPAVGVWFLVFVPSTITLMGGVRRWMVTRLLGERPGRSLAGRVVELESSRSALVDAVDAERRRFERDLHDGAQQRLVAVAMDLGMAKAKLDSASGVAPEVRSLIDGAHAEAKRAIAELRDVARGVHPAILEDRGLDAALSSLAARCPIPVTVEVDVADRPPRPIDAVAYYVVAESLTNVAKHAATQATRAVVRVTQQRGRLGIEITDDGPGGASIGGGGGSGAGLAGGLSGLRDRVASVDGTLLVLSPKGGPTTVLVELPCES